jgi:hypothetical protein
MHSQLAYSPNLHDFCMNNKPLVTNPAAKLAPIHFTSPNASRSPGMSEPCIIIIYIAGTGGFLLAFPNLLSAFISDCFS